MPTHSTHRRPKPREKQEATTKNKVTTFSKTKDTLRPIRIPSPPKKEKDRDTACIIENKNEKKLQIIYYQLTINIMTLLE